jgi:malate/lactate dehydrogenase
MELGDVSLSLPSIVNRGGIARVLSVPLNSSERKALRSLCRRSQKKHSDSCSDNPTACDAERLPRGEV